MFSALRSSRLGLIIALGVFVLVWALPVVPILDASARQMLAFSLLLTILWVTEALPFAITSLLPLLCFPLMGVLPTKECAAYYANPILFFFLGGFLLAMAVEEHGLHRRMALTMLCRIGTSPKRLIAGFLASSAFISMWISNTSTAMLMLPIGLAACRIVARKEGEAVGTAADFSGSRLGSLIMLAIMIGATLGGMATVIGTPPNQILAGYWQEHYPHEQALSFFRWLRLGLPLALALLGCSFIVLTRFLDAESNKADENALQAELLREMQALGPIGQGERRVALLFFGTVLLWMFRAPLDLGVLVFPGWEALLPGGTARAIDDSTVAIAAAILLFVVPAGDKVGARLLSWKSAQEKLPWGMLLLFGGGYAVSAGYKVSGLDVGIGRLLDGAAAYPPWLLVLVVCAFATAFSEVSSNSAVTNILLPVVAVLAEQAHIPPIALLLPMTLAASNGFVLPIAAPNNAIAYGSGLLPMGLMLRAGVLMDAVSVLLIAGLGYLLL